MMTTMPIQQVMMMANTILSDASEKNSPIDSLTFRVNDLTASFDHWNRWMLWGLGFAAIAAIWIGLTTRMTIVRSKQLTIAQGELDSAKEARLQLDLVQAQTVASNAATRAATAERQLLELSKNEADRYLELGVLSSLLKGKAAGRITIWYEPNDSEAFVFAQSLFRELSDGGWKVLGTIPIPESASFSDALPEQYRNPRDNTLDRMFPISIRATGGTAGLALLARSLDPKHNPPGSPFEVLASALKPLSPKWGLRIMPSLPDGEFILVVCPKPTVGLATKP